MHLIQYVLVHASQSIYLFPHISFYAFFSSVLNILNIVETRRRQTDGPTDRATDRKTLSQIELLAQLKMKEFKRQDGKIKSEV